jgi:hypothetical protein
VTDAPVRFQETPNPNALKCVLPHRLGGGRRSYFRPGDARDDPLAAALFAIPGVANVLIHDDWVTVGKTPDADWKSLRPALERVLREAR